MSISVDFFGIGAQRAGTSWLWQNLRQHPDIWLPPRKELHYFDRALGYPTPSHLATDRLLIRLFGWHASQRQFRRRLINGMGRIVQHGNWSDLPWMLRYFSGTYNDAWYRSLFRAGQGKVTGEITPAYAILEDADVRHIQHLFPALKIIFVLRNPMDRAWSHIRFHWSQRRLKRACDFATLKHFIDAPAQALRSNYLRTLTTWTSHFSDNRIHLCFYDDLQQNPQQFIANICRFLDIDWRLLAHVETIHQKIHRSQAAAMPDEIAYYLATKYTPQLQELSHLFGGHATRWHLASENIFNRANPW